MLVAFAVFAAITQMEADLLCKLLIYIGGEGGIRTHVRVWQCVSYRFAIAGAAVSAVTAVAHYPKLPKSILVARSEKRPAARSLRGGRLELSISPPSYS